jgi:translation elongation factor EF-Ts
MAIAQDTRIQQLTERVERLEAAVQTLRATGDDAVLWTADKRRVRAAPAEGVLVVDPEASTLAEVQPMFPVAGS